MRLSIITAVCGAIDITEQWCAETIGNCTTNPEIIVVSNGNTAEEHEQLWRMFVPVTAAGATVKLIRAEEPLGSTKAFNAGLREAEGDVVAMLHNDLMIKERSWDAMVLNAFADAPTIGVAGFHGSRMLCDDAVYTSPYRLGNLGRGDSYSNMEDAESHGARSQLAMNVVTLDGMALIARREDLVAWGGLDERYVHHMYDHDLCTTARQHGRHNVLFPVRVRHISGQTANATKYNEHFADRGRDAGIHAAAHLAFWEKWRGTGLLPARI